MKKALLVVALLSGLLSFNVFAMYQLTKNTGSGNLPPGYDLNASCQYYTPFVNKADAYKLCDGATSSSNGHNSAYTKILWDNGTYSYEISTNYVSGCSTGDEVIDGICQPSPPQCDSGQHYDQSLQQCVTDCTDGYTTDPVTGNCVLSDGNTDNNLDPNTPQCDSAATCLSLANNTCASTGQVVLHFEYLGGSQYGGTCGYQQGTCDAAYSWSITDQTCLADADSDGTPDPYDPDPNDSGVTGDADGDGIPDSEDQAPNTPGQGYDSGPDYSGQPINVNPNPVAPVGSSTNFDDSAIVAAINQNTQVTNNTNQLIDKTNKRIEASNSLLTDIKSNTGYSKDYLEAIKNNTQDIGEIKNQVTNSNDTLSDIKTSLDPVDGTDTNNQISSLVNKSSDELGLPSVTDEHSQFVSTMFGQLNVGDCSNPDFNGHVIDLCSLSPTILPIANFICWGLTLIFIYFEFHSVLRRRGE